MSGVPLRRRPDGGGHGCDLLEWRTVTIASSCVSTMSYCACLNSLTCVKPDGFGERRPRACSVLIVLVRHSLSYRLMPRSRSRPIATNCANSCPIDRPRSMLNASSGARALARIRAADRGATAAMLSMRLPSFSAPRTVAGTLHAGPSVLHTCHCSHEPACAFSGSGKSVGLCFYDRFETCCRREQGFELFM